MQVRGEPAGARRDEIGRGLRGAQQGHQNDGVAVGQPVGGLSEEPAGGRAHPLPFPAKGDEIEIGLEDLTLGPGGFDRPRRLRLVPFLRQRAPILRCAEPAWIDQRRQLHRDRAGAASRLAGQPGRGRGGERRPIDAMVFKKAAVFAHEKRRHQRRREFLQGHPVQPPAFR